MIVEYHRPTSVDAALKLITRSDPPGAALGGGTVLNQPGDRPFAAVDLQALGWDTLTRRGNFIDLGATLTLQSLLDSDLAQLALKEAIRREASYNLRQAATVAGTLVVAGGRSPFATALLALDAAVTLLPGEEIVELGNLLPVRGERLPGRLISQVTLPANARLAYQYVARSPADRPVVCVAAAAWPSGRTRVALGGFGNAPRLVLDGTEPAGAQEAAQDAYSQEGDEWASASYRSAVASILARRCLEELEPGAG